MKTTNALKMTDFLNAQLMLSQEQEISEIDLISIELEDLDHQFHSIASKSRSLCNQPMRFLKYQLEHIDRKLMVLNIDFSKVDYYQGKHKTKLLKSIKKRIADFKKKFHSLNSLYGSEMLGA